MVIVEDYEGQENFDESNNELSLESIDKERINPSYEQVDFLSEWWYQFSSPATIVDINLELMVNLFDENANVGNPTVINTMEAIEFDKISEKIYAIVAASGILNDLEPEQLEAFEKAIDRSIPSENE
jgi:hypothetical protein